MFAGWTADQTAAAKVIPAEDTTRLHDKLIGSAYTIPENAESEITVYAMYAADENNDGKPDYLSKVAHIEYYANGGTSIDANITIGADGKFYTCQHSHLPGDTVTDLLAIKDGSTNAASMIKRTGATLIGWSATVNEDLYTAASEDGALVSSVTIPAADASGNTVNAKLYAIWAVDKNGNDIPDYEETTKYTHTYHHNEALTYWDPTRQNPVSDTEVMPNGVAAIEYAADGSLSDTTEDILPGAYIELAGNTLKTRTDKDADGNVVYITFRLAGAARRILR